MPTEATMPDQSPGGTPPGGSLALLARYKVRVPTNLDSHTEVCACVVNVPAKVKTNTIIKPTDKTSILTLKTSETFVEKTHIQPTRQRKIFSSRLVVLF